MKFLLPKAPFVAVGAAVFFLTVGAMGHAADIARVPWEQDPAWAAVLEKAKAGDQSILLDFHASWCGPCKMLDSFVYNEAAVIQELAQVLTVKFDVDIETNVKLKDSFNISLLPTVIWCDSNGQEIDRFTGFLNRDEFLGKMGEFRQAENDFGTVRQELQRRPESPQLLLRLADLEAKRGNFPEAEKTYRRLINMRFSENISEEASQCVSQGMLQLAAMQRTAGQDSEAKNMGRMAARLDGSEVSVAAFQESIGDGAGVLETYRQMIARDDMDVQALVGFAKASLDQRVHLVEGSRMAIRAAVLSDEDPEIVALLSDIFYRRGLYRKSIRWIKKAIKTEPANNDYTSRLEYFESALRNDPHGMKGVPD